MTAAFPWRRAHRLAAGFLAVLVIRFHAALFSTIPLGDEAPYLEAMTHLLGGDSPYDGFGYFYPPAFAVLGARLLDVVGPTGVLVLLRLANLLGAAWLTACSVVFVRGSERSRFAVGALLLALSPAVSLAFEWGNLSPAISGLAIAALVDWPRRPWTAALGLGLATAVKPMTAAALVVLPVDRLARDGRRVDLRPWLAAAAIQLGALAVGTPYLRDFLGQDGGWPTATRSVSLQRLAHLCGVDLRASVILLAVCLAAVVLAVRLARADAPPIAVVALAVGASLWATPVIWSHTLLLMLPLEAIAADRALARWRAARAAPTLQTPWRRWEPAFVGLAILALHMVEGIGGIELMARPILVVATLGVHAALVGLLVYAGRAEPAAQR